MKGTRHSPEHIARLLWNADGPPRQGHDVSQVAERLQPSAADTRKIGIHPSLRGRTPVPGSLRLTAGAGELDRRRPGRPSAHGLRPESTLRPRATADVGRCPGGDAARSRRCQRRRPTSPPRSAAGQSLARVGQSSCPLTHANGSSADDSYPHLPAWPQPHTGKAPGTGAYSSNTLPNSGPVWTTTVLVSTYSRTPTIPFSRPSPLSLVPPYGNVQCTGR